MPDTQPSMSLLEGKPAQPWFPVSPPSVNESDLSCIVASLDASLEVYRKNAERLEVADIRIQSMISALRFELLERLRRLKVAGPGEAG
ncbi:MAG: hypothetical protein ACREFX_05710 [Opitutaceae bacterium]